MCIECWKQYGSPVIINDKVLKAVKLIEKIDDYHPNMHFQIDDWNLEDEFFYPKYNKRLSKDESSCFECLKSLTLDERASALALNQFEKDFKTKENRNSMKDQYKKIPVFSVQH